MASIADVRALHSELSDSAAYPDADITAMLAEADLHMDSGVWGTLYEKGHALLAAHLLYDASGQDLRGNARGVLTGERMGPASFSYAAKASSATDFLNRNASTFGRRHMALEKTLALGPIDLWS